MVSKILLVEDSASDADYLIELLEELNAESIEEGKQALYELEWVSSLKDALNKLDTESYDLVFLDLGLPDSYGLESITRFMNSKIDTPLVVLTGDLNRHLWHEAILLGAQDYLVKKEIDLRLLQRTIRYSVERFKLKNQLKKSLDEQKSFSEQLQESNNKLEQFAYVASHDLQGPVRSIIGFSERIKEGNDPAKFGEYVQRINKAAKRMQSLLSDFLEFAKLDNDNFEKTELDLNKVFYEVFCDMESIILSSKAGISFSIEDGDHYLVAERGILNSVFADSKLSLPTILANESQIRVIFENIISNSIKYQLPGERAQIKIVSRASKDGLWEVTIKDNGIGFDEQYKDKIFEQLQRLHGYDQYEGTGMGLASVKKIVDFYSGEILVSSQPNQGTEFTVRLPILSRKFLLLN